MNIFRKLAALLGRQQEQHIEDKDRTIVSTMGSGQPSPHQADNQRLISRTTIAYRHGTQQNKCMRNNQSDKDNVNTQPRVTPEYISELQPNEVFVFGSNARGMHYGGAAAFAVGRFGAIMGQGEGLQGQSYAIPTMEGMENMRAAVDRFIAFVKEHPELIFLVTPIGCGIAGYTSEEVAPLFLEAATLPNICLPKPFWKCLRDLS